MNVNLGIWSKLTKIVVGLVVVAVVLLIGVSYLPLIHENERMQKEKLRLETEVQNETEKSQRLQAEIEALRNDPKTVERLARETLGYSRTNEIVIRFEPPATNAPGR